MLCYYQTKSPVPKKFTKSGDLGASGLHQIQQATGCGYDDIYRLFVERLVLLLIAFTANQGHGMNGAIAIGLSIGYGIDFEINISN